MAADDWFSVREAGMIDTPALLLYPDRVQHNINLFRGSVADPARLRPHVKTHKCAEVARMMLAAGITKFKCATIAEAELLALQEAPDVLLAYQPVGPKALRLCALQQQFQGTVFSCLADNAATLRDLSAAAQQQGTTLRVYLDLNVGMHRTGILPGDEALALYLEARVMPGIDMQGLHAYDGHLRDTDLPTRTRRCDEAFAPVEAMRDVLQKKTGTRPALVAGGSPTFPIHAQHDGREVSPGTFVFWDAGYRDILPEQAFLWAALVMTRVISKPDERTICVDLGHKSVASENPLPGRVRFLNAPGLEPVSHSEEHMVLRIPDSASFSVGDVLYGVPYHICPTVALFDHAQVCRHHSLQTTWSIGARNRKITF